MRVRPLLPVLVGSALLVAGLTSCTEGGDVVTVYSGRSEDLIAPLLEDYAEQTGADIEVRYGDTTDLALLIQEEGDQSPADVFLSQSPGSVAFLDQEGLLAELPSAVLDLVPAEEEADDGTWVGVSGRQRVLVYNPDLVADDELPASVFDLLEPDYDGRVAVAPTNASFQDFVTAMRSDIGDDETLAFLSGLADNGARSYDNNNAIVEAVGRGEIAMGLVNHYYNERAQAEDPDVNSENHYFEDGDLGGIVLVTAATELESSDDPEGAQQLIEFLLTPDAQAFYAEETLEYPLAADAEQPADLPPLGDQALDIPDFAELGGGLEGTIALIQESGLG
jgi:iron(III) transport system substrate-binding protein